MKNLFKFVIAAALVAALAVIWSANLQARGKHPEVVTNNDLKGTNTVSFFKFNGTTLTLQQTAASGGKGIGGGFPGLNRMALGGTSAVLCGFVSDAGSSDIAVFKVINKVVTKVGNFTDPQGSGKTQGIGLAVVGNFLLAAYTTSKNIGAWQIQSDCTLTLLANFKTPHAVAGMRVTPNGKTLIVGYGSGVNKVDSFSLAPTGLTEHGPYPATSGASGIDITQDSAYAIFGDTTSSKTEVEIYPIHANGTLGKRTHFGGNGTLGAGVGSSNVWLSVDEKFLFASNNSSKQVTSLGFTEKPLGLSYINITTVHNPSNQITSVAQVGTLFATGNGQYIVLAEDGSPNSFVAVLRINADGSTTEISGSPFSNGQGRGLQSFLIGPPRPF
ncbi:MAG TPA: hypothetical protein VN948_01830 [Terriglobales bacterium]|nr:hypothetical protein [Terriglobales bacterium]